jgi:shikimate kinase
MVEMSNFSAETLKGVNLFLIGMMGSGKSTTGKYLAQALGYHFFDTDQVIETLAKQPVRDIFAEDGETEFRRLETQVLAELSTHSQLVVATGGGIILDRFNWSYLRHGIVIWLNVPVQQLCDRLSSDSKSKDSRPLLDQGELEQNLTAILQQRQARYAQADLTIEVQHTDGYLQVVDHILTTLPTILKSKLEAE